MAPTSTSPSRPSLPHTTTANGTKLVLREANIDERHFTWTLNAGEWKGPLNEQAYYLREAHIGSQAITREGGQQYWILVDADDDYSRRDAEGHRLPNILSACETIRKPSMIFKMNGDTEEVVSYGIGGVYTAAEYRGKGYAKTMLNLLAQQLREYHHGGKRSGFSVLYSDIGKVIPASSFIVSSYPTYAERIMTDFIRYVEILLQSRMASSSIIPPSHTCLETLRLSPFQGQCQAPTNW